MDDYVPLYRLVSDYGYGDKKYLDRDLTAEQAVERWNHWHGTKYTSFDQLPKDRGLIHHVEEDDGAAEDWNWQDS